MAWEGDNLATALLLPAVDRRSSASASLQENIDGHDEGEVSCTDVHPSPNNLVIRNFIHKSWQPHTRLLLNNTPSSRRVEPELVADCKRFAGIYFRPISGHLA